MKKKLYKLKKTNEYFIHDGIAFMKIDKITFFYDLSVLLINLQLFNMQQCKYAAWNRGLELESELICEFQNTKELISLFPEYLI